MQNTNSGPRKIYCSYLLTLNKWKTPEKVPRLSIESRDNLSRNLSSASHYIIRNKLSKVCGTVVYGGLGVDHNFCIVLAGISVLHPPCLLRGENAVPRLGTLGHQIGPQIFNRSTWRGGREVLCFRFEGQCSH